MESWKDCFKVERNIESFFRLRSREWGSAWNQFPLCSKLLSRSIYQVLVHLDRMGRSQNFLHFNQFCYENHEQLRYILKLYFLFLCDFLQSLTHSWWFKYLFLPDKREIIYSSLHFSKRIQVQLPLVILYQWQTLLGLILELLWVVLQQTPPWWLMWTQRMLVKPTDATHHIPPSLLSHF